MQKTNLPVILLRGIVLLPYSDLKIDLMDLLDTKIINLASSNHEGFVLLISPLDFESEEVEINNLPKLGVIGKITKKITLPNGCTRVTISGMKRAKIDNVFAYPNEKDVFACNISNPTKYAMSSSDERALVIKLKRELENYINKVSYASNSILAQVSDVTKVSKLADIVASYMPTSFERKYEFLNCLNPHTRVIMNLEDIKKELDVFELENKIDLKLKKELDNNQKEFILREKIRIIKEELGDISSKDEDVSELREKINKLDAPIGIKEKLNKELKKYESTPSTSPEVGIIRNYIDLILSLPWNNYTTDNNDISLIKKELDSSHYGLLDIKERIIEYIAVKDMKKINNSPIICFVGPPGVGKTTLAKSIANALNRKFVKISVGGVNDPAEIVGHRRTYMGASPGRIINALKKCGTNNPVFLIDEIDKMTKDIKGDPLSSLLEVLDKEQNDKFYDNYVEEAYDLSNVMFILTANYIDKIPEELKDRLEIINLYSYTLYEKLFIAKNYLIKRLFDEYNLSSKNIKFSDEVIEKIIINYTKEAGVRDLYRKLEKIIRKCVILNAQSNKKTFSISITLNKLEELLGKKKYESNTSLSDDKYGVVNALAYTVYGGDILPLECVIYDSFESKIITTGNLGDVMKESITISLGYIKSHAKDFKINMNILENKCIHLNAIEAAVLKDGPSAGTAITTVLISLLTKKKVSNSYAFTGEMTLTGKVLAIGGLKEKLIGALKANVKTVFIPKDNESDIDLLPKEVKDNLNIITVTYYKEIYDEIFKK